MIQLGEFGFKFVWKIYTYISTWAGVMFDAFRRKEQNHNCEAKVCHEKTAYLMMDGVFWFSLKWMVSLI